MSDIDDILSEIEEEPETTEIEVVETREIANVDEVDVTEFESLANELLKMTQEDRKLADKTFELFYPDISMGRDKTKGSAEAITKAVELKIEAGRNIIDIMKLLKQEKPTGNNVGIFFNSKKTGIDLTNVAEEIDD